MPADGADALHTAGVSTAGRGSMHHSGPVIQIAVGRNIILIIIGYSSTRICIVNIRISSYWDDDSRIYS